jgi:peptidoglycan/LPS O-acetylase OafA/YrhL
MALAVEDRVRVPPPVRRAAARGKTRLAALDGLRLLCALGVAGYHFGDSWRLDGVNPPAHFLPGAAPVLIYGFVGVEVFFLISGFVILMSAWDSTIREFAASRVARLYPAFWVCVILTAVVVMLVPVTTGVPVSRVPTPGNVVVNLTMLAEPLHQPLVDTVYWTLWIELRFYLIVAFLIGAGLSDRRMRIVGTVWLAAAVVLPAYPKGFLHEIVMPDFAPYFIAGMTMFLLRRNRTDWRLWVLLGCCWLVSLQRVEVRALDLKPGYFVRTWPALVLLTIGYAVLLAIAFGLTDRLNWRWLGTAGALTYPFYLLHQRIGYRLIRTAYQHTGLPAGVLIAGAVVVLLVLAWLVHRLVERPLASVLRARILARGRKPEKVVAAGTVPNM